MSAENPGQVRVTSHAQADAWRGGRLAEPEQLDAGLWALALPIPEGHLPSSFGYALLGDDGVHVIDPGWDSDESLGHWKAFLASQGRSVSDIATILVTHSHPDHLGLAGRLRELTGANLLMTVAESDVLNLAVPTSLDADGWMVAEMRRWGMPGRVREELLSSLDSSQFSVPILPDQTVADGEVLRLAGRSLLAHATPGHTEGHLCLEDRAAGLLFTGDHVLPKIFPGIGLGQLPGSNPLISYLSSLARVAKLDHCEVLPGHEYRFRGLGARCEQIAAHHLRRTAAVRDTLRCAPESSTWEITRRLPWTRGFENLQGFSLQSALRQTEMHLAAVRSGDAAEWFAASAISHAG